MQPWDHDHAVAPRRRCPLHDSPSRVSYLHSDSVTDEGIEGTVGRQLSTDAAPSASSASRSPRADWVFYSLLVLACLGLLYVASLPGLPLIWLTPVLALWIVVGIVWLVRLISAIQRRSLTASLVIAPLVALVVAALFLSPLPLQARFALSRSAFDQTVQSLPVNQGAGGSLGLVGTYRIEQWSRAADGVLFDQASGTGVGLACE